MSGKLYTAGGKPAIGLSEAAQWRLIEAMRELHYEPVNPLIRLRVYPELGDYCYLLDDAVAEGIANRYHSRIFSGVVATLSSQGRHGLVFNIDGEADYLDRPDKLPTAVTRHLATRYITAGRPNYSLLTALRRRGLPVVHVSRTVDFEGVSSIVPDYAAAGRLAVEHLLALGHRRITVVAAPYMQPDAYNVRTLIAGAAGAFAAAGQPFAPGDVLYNPALESAPAAAWQVLAHRRSTAVFCLDDYTALLLMRAALRASLRLPQDLGIVGCNDDVRLPSAGPELTTVRFPLAELGATAVRVLEESQLKPGPARAVILPVEFQVRESTASAPAA